MEINRYKSTRHHGTFETDQDFHIVGFCLVSLISSTVEESKIAKFPPYNFILECYSIAFFMLTSADTSRHYLPVDVIKQIIESMSYAKLVSYAIHLGAFYFTNRIKSSIRLIIIPSFYYLFCM